MKSGAPASYNIRFARNKCVFIRGMVLKRRMKKESFLIESNLSTELDENFRLS